MTDRADMLERRPIELFRDPGQGEHVSQMPPWVLPRSNGRYWHRPRSASVHGDGRLYVRFWCGQAGTVDLHRLTHEVPEDLKCGTCVGRRAGWDRADGTVFRPRDHWALPSRCPGNSWEPPKYRTCFACGRPVQAARGWNAWGSASHRPDPDLADRFEPCPQHGWREMYERDGALVCNAWRCDWVSPRPVDSAP